MRRSDYYLLIGWMVAAPHVSGWLSVALCAWFVLLACWFAAKEPA